MQLPNLLNNLPEPDLDALSFCDHTAAALGDWLSGLPMANTDEAAEKLRLASGETFSRFARRYGIPLVRFGPKIVRVSAADLSEAIRAHRTCGSESKDGDHPSDPKRDLRRALGEIDAEDDRHEIAADAEIRDPGS